MKDIGRVKKGILYGLGVFVIVFLLLTVNSLIKYPETELSMSQL